MIRSIMTTDIDALCKINSEELGYDYPREQSLTQLRKILNDSNHYLLALYEDETTEKILGYVHAEVYEEIYAEPTLNVLALAVTRDSQNIGVGTQLMSWLENTAVSKGYKSIRLNSGMSRKSAHGFYEHINYVHIKNQKKFIKKL
ncbi:GNAT family N-acetyltransferase [Leuconostoc gelidum]|uniref:GNAT family N-acetyltransferase n=1 Tax=Leuconostoc gelidum TaxID=1244 RepID=UPI001C7D9808|nr:GNAT family N-acetyltransferase [Leuconostoc gelidum]MBZ6008205.1 GNAT family N-acetyltransferase [Leuconostoc gelidum subsp. aenigmaticum]MBZ6010912.1 GNAT family N-acetyltransferase [Leuconostoc gelidum subsp. aenigmaticum]